MTKTKQPKKVLLFDKRKYTIMIAGLTITALGFLLMVGGGSDDPSKFSYEIFSFRRITLAPILVLLGFAVQIYVILSKKTNNTEKDTEKK